MSKFKVGDRVVLEDGGKATLTHIDEDGDWWAFSDGEDYKFCLQKEITQFKLLDDEN